MIRKKMKKYVSEQIIEEAANELILLGTAVATSAAAIILWGRKIYKERLYKCVGPMNMTEFTRCRISALKSIISDLKSKKNKM